MSRPSSRQHVLRAIQTQVLPRLQQGEWDIVLAEPPFQLPSQVTTTLHQGKPLLQMNARHHNAISSMLHLWPDVQVHSSSVPMMGFVLEGAMDWRIGITAAAARQLGGQWKHSDYAVLALPKSTFFLAPPGVPYGTGLLKHWERSVSGVSRDTLWMRFYPLGMQCHLGHGDASGYKAGPPSIFPEARCYFAIQSLLEELRLNGEYARESMQGLLLFIMARITHALQKLHAPEWRPVGPEITVKSSAAHAVDAACAYIEAHFFQKITLAEIAEHALVSPTHLSYLFHREKQMTLTDYITRYRMEYATSLLQHTRMSLGQIARTVGYGNQSYFCQIFARHFQCSPGEYRKNIIKQQNK